MAILRASPTFARLKMKRITALGRAISRAGLVALALGWCGRAIAAALPPLASDVCLDCHGQSSLKRIEPTRRAVSLYVDRDTLASSVHADLECVNCHRDVTAIPHRSPVAAVNCRRCHYVEPLPRPTPRGAARGGAGVHQQALEAGVVDAPTCQTCHGSHDVLAPGNPRSRVHRTRVSETCGRCHLAEYAQYQGSVHGVALARGNPDVPVCSDCHGSHTIAGPRAPGSPVGVRAIPETCGRCHESEPLARKYQVPPERLATYRESYHGLANQFGSTRVANCASCHGAHDIRPSTDPQSSIYPANLARTCGRCHPDASANFARGKVHVRPRLSESVPLWLVSTGFKWFTIAVMSALIGHIILDLNARRRERRAGPG